MKVRSLGDAKFPGKERVKGVVYLARLCTRHRFKGNFEIYDNGSWGLWSKEYFEVVPDDTPVTNEQYEIY